MEVADQRHVHFHAVELFADRRHGGGRGRGVDRDAVPIASAVSVLDIDCTTTGASPPTQTLRSPCWTSTLRLARRASGPDGMGM
jgi:hypothetical protein